MTGKPTWRFSEPTREWDQRGYLVDNQDGRADWSLYSGEVGLSGEGFDLGTSRDLYIAAYLGLLDVLPRQLENFQGAE